MKRILLIVGGLIIVLAALVEGGLYWFLSGDGIRRTIERQASAWLGQPVQVGSARAQFYPRIGIQLGNVRAGNPVHVTLQTVSISAPLRPLLNRRIEDAEITLSNSRIDLPLPFSLPTSSGDQTTASSSTEGSMRLVSIRAITLRDVTIASRGKQVTVSADSSLVGSRLDLQRVSARSGRTELDASGVVQLEPAVDANLNVKANRLDVDELLALSSAFTPPPGPAPSRATTTDSTAKPAHVHATVVASTARAGDIEVRDFSTTIDGKGPGRVLGRGFSPGEVSLSPLTFQLFDGRYDGSIAATLGKTMSATIRSRVSNVDVAQLAAFGGAADTITGRLSGAGTFTGQGVDFASALAAARGNGSADMTQGAIKRLDLVRTVVLFFGQPAPDGGDSSNRYDRIDLRFSLANQVFHADAFALQSPDFDLTGTGSMRVPTKALDGSFNLTLSEKLSAQAGTDLVRYTREGNRVVLPAKLSGSLERPHVVIDAQAAITRGIRNEAERRLKGLLDGVLK